MLNPLDTKLFNYYTAQGKNITEFVLNGETILNAERPKDEAIAGKAKGYSFEIKAQLKHKLFTDLKNSDRHFWIWGTPVR